MRDKALGVVRQKNTTQISFSIYNALMSGELWIFLLLAIAQVVVSKHSCGSQATQGTEDTGPNSTRSRTEASAIRDIVLTQTRAEFGPGNQRLFCITLVIDSSLGEIIGLWIY